MYLQKGTVRSIDTERKKAVVEEDGSGRIWRLNKYQRRKICLILGPEKPSSPSLGIHDTTGLPSVGDRLALDVQTGAEEKVCWALLCDWEAACLLTNVAQEEAPLLVREMIDVLGIPTIAVVLDFLGRGRLSIEEIQNFVRHTPGAKRGDALLAEFKKRKASSTSSTYDFACFIQSHLEKIGLKSLLM